MLTVDINIIIELKGVACLGGQDRRITYGGTNKAIWLECARWC